MIEKLEKLSDPSQVGGQEDEVSEESRVVELVELVLVEVDARALIGSAVVCSAVVGPVVLVVELV